MTCPCHCLRANEQMKAWAQQLEDKDLCLCHFFDHIGQRGEGVRCLNDVKYAHMISNIDC